MKNKLFVMILMFFCSCGAKQDIKETKVNTRINKRYIASREGFYGTMNKDELNFFYSTFIRETGVQIDSTKSLLINFMQDGKNCSIESLKTSSKIDILKNYIESSERLTERYGATDLFVYTENSFVTEIKSSAPKWMKDNGFLKSNIFASNESCGGFIIIRTNGQFYKHYGIDYFSEVEKLLSSQVWDMNN